MKIKRFSKLDTFQDSVKIVSKKTGEILTISRFHSLLDFLGKYIRRLREWLSKRPPIRYIFRSRKGS